MVDLGLPSGIKWADKNIGADAPEASGEYFSWGETFVKETYSLSSYSLYDSQTERYKDIGDDISGTIYDVAQAKWGGKWCMPTKEQIQELFQNCTVSADVVNDVNGFRFLGSNGNSIFLPCVNDENNYGLYWTSSKMNESEAYFLEFTPFAGGHIWYDYTEGMFFFKGYSVRPVIK